MISLKAVAENGGKLAEKAKEMKGKLEKADLSEVKECSENQKKVIETPDVETAKSNSLASVIEENKAKREASENESPKADEGVNSREGLAEEQKEYYKRETGWSDEIVDRISSLEEAQIYKDANLKEVEVNGQKCLIRDDIDPDYKDEDGISNRERMERGRPPLTKDGEEVELHHIGQKPDSPLAELTIKEHRGIGNDKILHEKTKETEINRNEFGRERHDHWMDRVMSMEGKG